MVILLKSAGCFLSSGGLQSSLLLERYLLASNADPQPAGTDLLLALALGPFQGRSFSLPSQIL